MKLSYVITAALSVVATLGAVRSLAPEERVPRVGYDDFKRDVASGRVDEIKIDDRRYRYRLRESGKSAQQREAMGPEPTLSELGSMHPTNPDDRPPRIWFEP